MRSTNERLTAELDVAAADRARLESDMSELNSRLDLTRSSQEETGAEEEKRNAELAALQSANKELALQIDLLKAELQTAANDIDEKNKEVGIFPRALFSNFDVCLPSRLFLEISDQHFCSFGEGVFVVWQIDGLMERIGDLEKNEGTGEQLIETLA